MEVAGWLQLHARSLPYPLFSANSTMYVMYVGWSGNSGRNPLAWWRRHPCLPPVFVTIDAEFQSFASALPPVACQPTCVVLVIAEQIRVLFRAVVAQPASLALNLLFETTLSQGVSRLVSPFRVSAKPTPGAITRSP